ncbi:MAG: RDD family protein [Gammaproteobacteria bacterium]|nr:RDD family protein [Gammaproteobacteria bacterium]
MEKLLVPAPFGRYLAALFYDCLLVFGLLLIASFVYLIPFLLQTDSTNKENLSTTAFNGALYKTYILFIWFAFLGRFWTHGGQTLGMAAWKIKVVKMDGSPITIWQALLRFLAAAAPWISVFFLYYLMNKNAWLESYNIWVVLFGLSGIFSSLIDKQKLSFHDKFSETRLILTTEKTDKC